MHDAEGSRDGGGNYWVKILCREACDCAYGFLGGGGDLGQGDCFGQWRFLEYGEDETSSLEEGVRG